ncbi:hypothetical protein H6P81_016015 [Aristolochia fimbriata]|uniref:Uncharacterized protein n=1 Tax=Aristolochia fimbriata TaxID=158543 RepID=A0AAV7E749_ARIFI|nr:hypothetical protein H6P81_016015 [Aristolochia fimbriata]
MTRNPFIPLSGSVTSCAAHPLNGTTVAGTQVRETTTTVWQMDEFRCRDAYYNVKLKLVWAEAAVNPSSFSSSLLQQVCIHHDSTCILS